MDVPSPIDQTQASLDNLVELAQAGDEKAFTALFTYYIPGLSRYLEGLVQCIEDRDELTQETFLKAWKGLPGLQQVNRFRTWLYRIATNLAYDRSRRRKSFSCVSLDEHAELESSVRFEDQVGEQEVVKMALKRIPWKYRECLLLEIEGRLSHEEIAEILDISPKSVSTYISYARQHFREQYRQLQQEQTVVQERRGAQ